MNPDYLNSVVTLIVGISAFVIFWLGKRSEKRNAAAIIVMDIRHAEKVVYTLLERGAIDRSMKRILHENNWARYKHLFASKFSYDDLESLNRFFDSCTEIEEARRRMIEVFYTTVSAKAELLQKSIFETNDLETQEGREKRAAIIHRFNKEDSFFDPDDPKSVVLWSLQVMGKPSNLPAFETLRKIAKIH